MLDNTTPLEKLGRDWTGWIASAGLVIALVMLLLTGLATYRNVRAFAESADWVVHTREVLASLESLSSNLADAVDKSRNAIHFEIDDDVDEIQGDVTKVRQVLYNLLANASKFTEDGTITVRVGQNLVKNQLVIGVEDTGIGMTEGQVERLFQPFMQADASTTRRYHVHCHLAHRP